MAALLSHFVHVPVTLGRRDNYVEIMEDSRPDECKQLTEYLGESVKDSVALVKFMLDLH